MLLYKGLSALHIGVALPSTESIEITNLLLQHGADPDARDNYFGEKQDGRTALHIVCCREDDYIAANKIAEMLLQCGASPDLLSCGSSALSLAIASGNDLVRFFFNNSINNFSELFCNLYLVIYINNLK